MSTKNEFIFIDGKDCTRNIDSYRLQSGRYTIKYKNSGKEYFYKPNRVQIKQKAPSDFQIHDILSYIKRISEIIGNHPDFESNILSKTFSSIHHIPTKCVLKDYISGKLIRDKNKASNKEYIFPFGFNLSQKTAVKRAFENKISIIEGPPGTGKTQTILNILANAVFEGKTVAVVSGNNSAVQNVFEKLQKQNLDFFIAKLGNAENKAEFIKSQKAVPDLNDYFLEPEKIMQIKERSKSLFNELAEKLAHINELANLRGELDQLQTEYKHFGNSIDKDIIIKTKGLKFKRNIHANQILQLWHDLEKLQDNTQKLGLVRRFWNFLKYGLNVKITAKLTIDDLILFVQENYYPKKINEFHSRIKELENASNDFSFSDKMKEYQSLALQIFKAKIFEIFGRKERKIYKIEELKTASEEFLSDYPVILSTTHSLSRCLSNKILYDFVIIDESSQVDIVTGALTFLCAKNTVIVGDTKQLPHIVKEEIKCKTDDIFNQYKIPESYRYSNQSIISSVTKVFPKIQKTLLREHYRCHPKIIEFCNKKFYDNQLIILSQGESQRQPLLVYKTVKGNHARDLMNQRQIDIIKKEIIPEQKLENEDLGIVTPYRNQTLALQKTFQKTHYIADTVDKFQGRENDIIILSTVDNEISDFTDNPNRLNVAVSRAVQQLIVVINDSEAEKDSNILDLVRYIEYNNFSINKSKLHSIFDLLYKGYEQKCAEIISKSEKVSEYDSENLMYALIGEVLQNEKFLKYGVISHFPLRRLFKDWSLLSEDERRYINNMQTHLDFLIYNKLTKDPILGIEVDGIKFHRQGSRQWNRDILKNQICDKYQFPLLRFRTNGSEEKAKLSAKLDGLTYSRKIYSEQIPTSSA